MNPPLSFLNECSPEEFVSRLGGIYEHSSWIALEVASGRPFSSCHHLEQAFRELVDRSSREKQLALIRNHPDLAGKLALDSLTLSSRHEQSSIGLDRLTSQEMDLFTGFNEAYKARFGFPFIICARENTKETILAAFQTRLTHTTETEVATALLEIHKIAHLRFQILFESFSSGS